MLNSFGPKEIVTLINNWSHISKLLRLGQSAFASAKHPASPILLFSKYH